MRIPFQRDGGTPRSAKRSPWVPTVRETGRSAEEERALESDDLAELLAATNAKRAARGKAHLSPDDVQLRVWSAEQEMRRRAAE